MSAGSLLAHSAVAAGVAGWPYEQNNAAKWDLLCCVPGSGLFYHCLQYLND